MVRLKQIGIDVAVHRTIEQARKSFAESENDILRRLLLGERARIPPDDALPAASSAEPVSRTRGMWTVEFLGKRIAAANLKDAYRTLLVTLSEHDQSFLGKFGEEKSRSRRYVARAPRELYASSPHLATDHAKPLAAGWFFDTNLSADQVGRRARAAARVAGLRYGQDLRILENLKEV